LHGTSCIVTPHPVTGPPYAGPPAFTHGPPPIAHCVFVYSVQMTKLPAYILILSLILLAACNGEKKDFMTPSSNIPVVNVNNEEYSVNGSVVGKTATDISASEDLLIEPLDSVLKTICEVNAEEVLKAGQSYDWTANTAKLHVDDSLSFGDFYKTVATMGFSGYPNIKYVVGLDYKDIYNLKLPTKSSMCFCSGDGPMLPFS